MKTAIAAALVVAASAAEAGPWAQGRGHVYLKLSVQRLRSTTLAAPDGTDFPIPRFVKQDAGLYAAIGLSDRFTLVADVPAWRSSDLEGFREESGIGDVRAGLQVQLGRSGAWVFAVRGTVQAPTGDETRAEGLLPTGSGVWEGDVVVGAGRSLAGGKGYAFFEVGPQLRGGGLRDGATYTAQIGWNVSPRVVVAANLRGVEPYSHAPRDVPLGSPVGVSDRVTYAGYGPTLIVKLGRGLGAQVDVDGAFRTRNLATGIVLRVGVSYSR